MLKDFTIASWAARPSKIISKTGDLKTFRDAQHVVEQISQDMLGRQNFFFSFFLRVWYLLQFGCRTPKNGRPSRSIEVLSLHMFGELVRCLFSVSFSVGKWLPRHQPCQVPRTRISPFISSILVGEMVGEPLYANPEWETLRFRFLAARLWADLRSRRPTGRLFRSSLLCRADRI